ncbi:methylenetetrahydrofolate reductase [NAD(P)H] [Humisphaera borealis]|uniref:Methylenetetrahydrofolate reductase n=1 Tax=Humisphaera borealis TaxID=2807512 RepID=A0A7M2X1W6_9BACT|nr:methylenetetrahydrofolate reductase [NAD(P)H] [Humisphaera borealis]QOV91432.1 methylenetetrahydrofolate reductase [NAD(P)H] [Humisphaera borealis]
MRIDEVAGHGKPIVSFEFFPPKTDAGFQSLFATIEELRPLQPSYVSVTYGAGGSTREKTVDLVVRIQRDIGIRAMAHLTCVGHTADQIGSVLDDLWAGGIRNVLALRGDPQVGQTTFTKTEGGFGYANELVGYVAGRHNFCIGVAGYPEGHPQCLNRSRDLEHLKQKVDAGANVIITQLFFDNADFYHFRDEARRMGIKVPIVAGIMPITNVAQIKRFVSMCGAKIPHPLLQKLESLEADPEAVYQYGIDYATQQCADLLKQGIDGLHYYTLNKSKATVDIVKRLRASGAV